MLFSKMLRLCRISLCLLAWLAATGSQWDVAQVIAWSRMFAGYSQQMSVADAAEKTFSGEMCPLCKVVQAGKQQETASTPRSPAPKADGKVPPADLVAVLPVVFSPSRRLVAVVPPCADALSRVRSAPPSPPPRLS